MFDIILLMIQIFIISVVFFTINVAYIILSAPNILYPSTALLFYLIFVFNYVFSLQKQEAKLSAEITESFVQKLPKQRLINELKMAQRVQQGLLMVESPNIEGVNIAKKCIPADNIGGDFYSFISNDFDSMSPMERSPGIIKYVHNENKYLGIVIGDVAGHGVSSALIMALSAGLFSEIGKRYSSPKKILEAANLDLMRYIENSQVTHVTAFYGVLNISTLEFHYSRAGHPNTLLQRNNDPIIELDSKGSFLGMFDSLEFEENTVQLKETVYTFTQTESPKQKGPMETFMVMTDFNIQFNSDQKSPLAPYCTNYSMKLIYIHNTKKLRMIDPLLF